MNKEREMTCIVCPNGCSLKVTYDDTNVININGALCIKGEEYAQNEIKSPMRNLTTTVKVIDGTLLLVSVRSDVPLPKENLKACMKFLKDISLKAPITMHQVIIKDILCTGANIIATKDIKILPKK